MARVCGPRALNQGAGEVRDRGPLPGGTQGWYLGVSWRRTARGMHMWSITLFTVLCGTRSLMAMESRAIAGGLSADHQLPGVPKAKEVLLNKLIHNHSIDPPEIVTQ
jgi:hypothetical protein